MKVKFFEPAKLYKAHEQEFDEAIKSVLTRGDLILRDDVEKFEKTLAEYVGTRYAVALNSCTDALYLSLRALGIGQGDKVLVPSRTFVASVQVIKQVGAEPVFYDLDGIVHPFDFYKDIKAIIPVHIEGAVDTHYSDIITLADKLNIPVIVDSAQALGAKHNDMRIGSDGDIQCFSFYPAKTLGCFGDGGALTTNNKEIYEWVKGARNHFKEDARDWGVNSRLDNLQAAILNVKFKYYNQALAKRDVIAIKYGLCLQGVEVPEHTKGRIWQDYIIRTPDRDALYEYLKAEGIETMKNNYPFPVPKLPLAQKYEDETLRLPCNELLTEDEINYVIEKVNAFK